MKAQFLLIALALAACSDDKPAEQAAAAPPEVANPAPVAQQAAPQQADMAAAETAEQKQSARDPCDLSGYDMSKMTVELHEQLVKECERSKQ